MVSGFAHSHGRFERSLLADAFGNIPILVVTRNVIAEPVLDLQRQRAFRIGVIIEKSQDLSILIVMKSDEFCF